MKTIAKKTFKTKIGIIIFLAGVASIFTPHFSGWVDVAFPSIGYEVLLPYILWETIFVITLALLSFYVLLSFTLKAPRNIKIIFASLAVGLLLLFLGIYPNFATEKFLGSKQRVSFFSVGGQTRIMWAGGAKTIRNDALSLLKEETDEKGFVNYETWSASLKKLGVYWIRIDRETETVIIYIPRTEFFDAAQFGYLITKGQEPEASALQSKDYRLWKLDEGIYLFQLG